MAIAIYGPSDDVSKAGDTMTGALTVVRPTSTDVVTQAQAAADSQARYKRDASGKQSWGSGAATPDVTLERESAAVAKLTGRLNISERMAVAGFLMPFGANKTRIPAVPPASLGFLFPPGHGWIAGGTGVVASEDLVDYVRGDRSLKLTTNNAGTQVRWRKTGIPAMDLTGKAIRLLIKIDDPSKVHHLSVYIGNSGFSNFYEYAFFTPGSGTNYIQPNQWTWITLSQAQITSQSGTYTRSSTNVLSSTTGFTEIQVAAYDNAAGGAYTMWIDGVEIVPDASNTFPKGVVSITFDDSWLNQYTNARPIMDQFGQRGTAYTICDVINPTPGASYMGMNQLKSLRKYSQWEIAGHAYSSTNHNQANGFASLTSDQVDKDFVLQKLWLEQNGFNSDNIAYPKGHFEKTTDGIWVHEIAERYFATGRTITGAYETFPLAERSKIRAVTGVTDQAGLGGALVSTLAAAGGALDRTMNNGAWLVLCMHLVTDGTATQSTEISKAGFQTLCTEINNRGLEVLPVNEVVSYYT